MFGRSENRHEICMFREMARVQYPANVALNSAGCLRQIPLALSNPTTWYTSASGDRNIITIPVGQGCSLSFVRPGVAAEGHSSICVVVAHLHAVSSRDGPRSVFNCDVRGKSTETPCFYYFSNQKPSIPHFASTSFTKPSISNFFQHGRWRLQP